MCYYPLCCSSDGGGLVVVEVVVVVLVVGLVVVVVSGVGKGGLGDKNPPIGSEKIFIHFLYNVKIVKKNYLIKK